MSASQTANPVWHARAERIIRSSCGILGDRNSATLAHAEAMVRCYAGSIAVSFTGTLRHQRPLLLRARARKCVALHASAHVRGRAGPSPLFRTSPLHRQRARGAASAGAKASAYACCSVRAFEGVSCIKISLEIKMIDFESAWALYEISWQHVRVPCDWLFWTPIPLAFRTQQGPTRRRLLLIHPTLEVPTNCASGRGRAHASSDIL